MKKQTKNVVTNCSRREKSSAYLAVLANADGVEG
jgi:hypothetical protein